MAVTPLHNILQVAAVKGHVCWRLHCPNTNTYVKQQNLWHWKLTLKVFKTSDQKYSIIIPQIVMSWVDLPFPNRTLLPRKSSKILTRNVLFRKHHDEEAFQRGSLLSVQTCFRTEAKSGHGRYFLFPFCYLKITKLSFRYHRITRLVLPW